MIIYVCRHRESGKRYVGLTKGKLAIRIKQHVWSGRWPIDRALRKHGVDAFDIDEIDNADSWIELCVKEKYWIKNLNTMVPNGYNLTAGGGGIFGYRHTPDTIKRIGDTQRGRKHQPPSQEARVNMARAATGRVLTPTERAKISAAKTGFKLSPEALASLRAKRAKQISPIVSAETRAKMRAINLARSPELLARINVAWRAGMTPEVRAKAGESNRGQKRSAETRAKMAAALTGRPVSAETKARISAGLRAYNAKRKAAA